MVTTKKITIGAILLIITATLIVVTNLNNDLKIDILKNESNFYIYNMTGDSQWVLSGTESWVLYINGKSYKPSSVTLKNVLLKDNKTKIIRTSKYIKNNASIIDEYTFDGNEKDIELFPITHTINITNCNNCTYKYNYNIYSERMNLVYDDIDYEGKNSLFYNVNDNRIINIRMFDPIWNVSGNISYNTPSLDPLNPNITSVLNCSVYVNFKNYSTGYTNGTNYTVMFSYFINKNQIAVYNDIQIKNTTPIIIYANKSIPANYTHKGDQVFCRVKMSTTAALNVTQSPLLTSNIVTVNNTIPVINSLIPANSSTVYITPNNPVTIYWNVTDINNDTLYTTLIRANYFQVLNASISPLSDMTGKNNITPSNIIYNSTNGWYDFNGLTSSMNLSNTNSMNLTTSFTIFMKVYPRTTSSSYSRLLSIESSNNAKGVSFYLPAQNTNNFTISWCLTKNTAETCSGTGAPQIFKNNWTTVAMTYNNSMARLFLNGVYANFNSTYVGPLNQTGSTIHIGNSDSGNRGLNGSLDDIMVFNTTLNASQILDLTNNVSPMIVAPNNIILWYPFTNASEINSTTNVTLLYNSTLSSYTWDNATNQLENYKWFISTTDMNSTVNSSIYNFNVSFLNWTVQYSPNVTSFSIIPTSSIGTFYPSGATDAYGTFNITNMENSTINVSVLSTKAIPSNIKLYFNILNSANSSGSSLCFQESANKTNQTGVDGNCALNYGGYYTGGSSNWYDGNYTTAVTGAGDITYYAPENAAVATWTIRYIPARTISSPYCNDQDANLSFGNFSNYTFDVNGGSSINIISNTTSVLVGKAPLYGTLTTRYFYQNNIFIFSLVDYSSPGGLSVNTFCYGRYFEEGIYWNITNTSVVKINTSYKSLVSILPNTSEYIIAYGVYNKSSIGLKTNFSWKAEK